MVSGFSVSLRTPLRGNLITVQDGWIYETMVFGAS